MNPITVVIVTPQSGLRYLAAITKDQKRAYEIFDKLDQSQQFTSVEIRKLKQEEFPLYLLEVDNRFKVVGPDFLSTEESLSLTGILYEIDKEYFPKKFDADEMGGELEHTHFGEEEDAEDFFFDPFGAHPRAK